MTTFRKPPVAPPDTVTDVSASSRRYVLVRTVFGLIWGIDAVLKWLPGFRSMFIGTISDAAKGQPAWLAPWFRFWVQLFGHSPATFAVLVAAAETAICICLLFGLLQRLGFAFGAVFALFIWAVGEGFGGPYASGATDIGSAIMYSVVFLALWVAVPRPVRAAAFGADRRLSEHRSLRWATFS